VVVGVALAGCGSDDSDRGTTAAVSKPAAASTAPTTITAAAKPAAKPYKQQLVDCLKDVAYATRQAGNVLRVESQGGDLIANIQVFATVRDARRFEDQLEVDHASGGKGTAIFLRDAGGDDRKVITDCLTP
jgi:hypothetical protein